MLRQASGLGQAARVCHDTLRAAGLPVYGVDLNRRFVQDTNFPSFAFVDGGGLRGEGTVLLHINGPLVPLAMTVLGRAFVRHKRVIAHWFWELPRVPEEWRLAAPFVHEICVNTQFIADAIRPISGTRPVHVVAYPLAQRQRENRQAARGPVQPFTVLVVLNIASSFARKNPCAAISAFRRAFGEDPSARLIVKYMNASAWPEGVRLMEGASSGAGNVELLGSTLDEAGIDALYARADVVLSLHRAEGLGLVIAEAMLRGLPVIATNWSGNTDFLSPTTGIPIRYDLVPVDDPQGNYRDGGMLWAEPDVDAAAAALRVLRGDPELRAKLGAAAAACVADIFDPARYVRQIQSLLAS
jgi:glycosyltransferase involved in cell wall biosynthesis